jgi:hypothetical protein
MKFSLIIPIAAYRSEYEKTMPYVFSLNKDGYSLCVEAARRLDVSKFDAVYFTTLKEYDNKYCVSDFLRLQFKRLKWLNAKVVLLENRTSSQPETIYETIKSENITGSIYIKDADCSFVSEVNPQNLIAAYQLEKLQWVDPQNKSYVDVDDGYYVTNIIEKRIISHNFCAGGYSFENVEDFTHYYDMLKDEQGLYLSHIIYAMLLDRHIFRPEYVNDYKDFSNEQR